MIYNGHPIGMVTMQFLFVPDTIDVTELPGWQGSSPAVMYIYFDPAASYVTDFNEQAAQEILQKARYKLTGFQVVGFDMPMEAEGVTVFMGVRGEYIQCFKL